MDKEFKKFMNLSELYVGDASMAISPEEEAVSSVRKIGGNINDIIYRIPNHIQNFLKSEDEREKRLYIDIIAKNIDLMETLWANLKNKIADIISKDSNSGEETEKEIKIVKIIPQND